MDLSHLTPINAVWQEIKLSSMRLKAQDEITDEEEMAAAVMTAATKTLISKVRSSPRRGCRHRTKKTKITPKG